MTKVAVGGVRLADKPLHLGHFVGTFAAAEVVGGFDRLVYVIKDTEPYLWHDVTAKEGMVLRLAQSALMLGGGAIVEPVLASVVLERAWRLSLIISDCTRHAAVVTAHFDKGAIRSGEYSGSVRNFLFPVDEAIIFTFLGAESFFSNADNERIVRFARDVQRKLRTVLHNPGLPLTSLVHYPGLPILHGADYHRMCTANKNVLPVLASASELQNFCLEAASLGAYFKAHPDRLAAWKAGERARVVDDDYLPLEILRVFKAVAEIAEVRAAIAGKDPRNSVASILYSALQARVVEWDQRLNMEIVPKWDYSKVVETSRLVAARAAAAWGALKARGINIFA